VDEMVAVTDRSTDLLTIGRFARLSGLSIGALRHYDELDLLRPASVDRFTGYRGYHREQLDRARLIARLRDLEMPLDEIRLVLATDDDAETRAVIEAHRERILARTFRLQFVLHQLGQLIDPTKETAMTAAPPLPPDVDPTTRRALAVGLFNRVWRLLETPDRTVEQDDEMVHAAHASRYHWGEVPTSERKNLAIGEWQCSRVYAVLGRAEPALHHARRCLEIVEGGDHEAWLRASAYEALARAHAVAGERDDAVAWKAKAVAAIALEPDKDDREVIEQDLATLPV
jgi:DNA-binding transcriptional MerR regulator